MLNKQIQNIEDPDKIPLTKHHTLLQPNWLKMPTRFIASFRKKLSLLNVSQWLYFIAIFILLMQDDQNIDQISELLWVGAIAGIGLIRELWNAFNRIWEHLLGKGLILVLYAATANFALAISALKINVITGIEPGPFIFTLGFATLIMLPFWMLLSTVVFFSVVLIAANLWLVIGVLLRIVRVKIQMHWEDKSFVFITMILRLVLIPYVIVSIVFIALPYARQIEIFEQSITFFKSAVQEGEENQQNDNVEISGQDSDDVTITINNRPLILSTLEEDQTKWLDKLIAGFVYHFETYPKSACQKLTNQRSLPIDENLVLLVTENDSELGYEFSVGPCKGNFPETE